MDTRRFHRGWADSVSFDADSLLQGREPTQKTDAEDKVEKERCAVEFEAQVI